MNNEITKKINALSQDSREWLKKTSERFQDSQGYDKNEPAIKECLEAGLIRKRRFYIEIDGEVIEQVQQP